MFQSGMLSTRKKDTGNFKKCWKIGGIPNALADATRQN